MTRQSLVCHPASGRVPDGERGVILINVLVIVMLATTVLALMLTGDDTDVDRNLRLRNAAQAMAVAKGGELSAVAALRRDLAAEASSDSLADEWASIGDSDVAIAGGRFSFQVTDAQALYNVNALAGQDVIARATFAEIAKVAQLPPDTGDRIAVLLAATGPVSQLSDLRLIGLNDAQLARMAKLCTALPDKTDVNLNTAPEPLVAILVGNPAAARMLVASRGTARALNADVLRSAGIFQPPGTSLTSNWFWARGRATIGDTAQHLTSLLHRGVAGRKPVVVAVRRWRGPAPIEVAPLPVAKAG